jgi:Ca2+-binding EF-hand superfamily protein
MQKFKFVIGMCLFFLILGTTCSFAQTAADAKAKAQEHINAMDTNKDGQISKEEFMATCKGNNCSQRFDALDTNKDGFLTKEEAQELAATAKGKAATAKENIKNKRQSGQQPTN